MKKNKAIMAGVAVLVAATTASAGTVTLTGVDGFGLSSFNTAGLWDSAAAPTAGNDYIVPDATRLRTPADGNSYTFAGDSLTINNTTAYGDGFMFKGTGNAGTITVDNLIFDGGLLSHANGTGDIFNLDGALMVATGGARLYAKQGPVNIHSDISGSGTITVMTPDADGLCKLWLYSSANTFTGNIIQDGRLGLVDGANLNFVIGAAGVNNAVTYGAGVKHTTFDGIFDFDLSGAGTTLGDSWQVVPAGTNSPTYYGATFVVNGFAKDGGGTGYGIWNGSANGAEYQFDPDAGTLTVIPEPATLGLIGFFGAGMLFVRRRFKI